ncbi:MAG: lysine biosynthesis protein LysW [Gammaproteobacteria bacterium]|nr:lysine biosynthesis protein LysW [Gammaproteobacteria bacterium]
MCIECEGDVFLATGTEENELVVCPDCGVDLEILSIEPLTVDLAPMEDEDWGE